jgi:DNA adenine methylase
MEVKKSKPFLRWAGGKLWMQKHLEELLPSSFGGYFEPFLGGGSVFIYLASREKLNEKILLSDINGDLINTFETVRDRTDELINVLSRYKNQKDFYYKLRAKNEVDSLKKAASFIYFNRTSFNGIYRVNRQGKYNVPYGNKRYKELFDVENIRNVANLLKGVCLKEASFKDVLKYPQKGDFVFLDPPYTVAHENNGFIRYNQNLFSWDDQEDLKNHLFKLNQRGVKYMLTNAYHKSIKELFKNVGDCQVLERSSSVGGKGATRQRIKEYVFTNF